MNKIESIDVKERILYIDGMRGVLAVLVVVNHVVCAFFPWFFYNSRATSIISKLWVNGPLNALTNGNFAVQLFYIISGYLISKKYIEKGNTIFKPLDLLIKTLRITIPSILLICALMKIGWTYNVDAVLLNPSLSILEAHNNFVPSWGEAIYEALFKIFTVAACKYNAPLWFIMPYFWGTIGVHLLNGYYQRIEKYGYIAILTFICIAGLFFVNYSACGMLFGLLVAYTEKYDNRVLEYIHKKKVLYIVYLLMIIYFATINIEATGIWSILPLNNSMTRITIIRQAACGLLFYEITRSKWLKGLLALRPFRALGKASMFIFTYHWAVLISFGCKLYIFMRHEEIPGIIEGSILLIFIILVTVIMYRIIDLVQSKTIKKIKGVLIKNRGKSIGASK